MLITKKNILTGESRTLDIPIEPEDYREYLEGESLDIVAPYLCNFDKKFILTGLTEEDDNY